MVYRHGVLTVEYTQRKKGFVRFQLFPRSNVKHILVGVEVRLDQVHVTLSKSLLIKYSEETPTLGETGVKEYIISFSVISFSSS